MFYWIGYQLIRLLEWLLREKAPDLTRGEVIGCQKAVNVLTNMAIKGWLRN